MRRTRSTIRVRYQETDRMGVAHHSAFLAWFEEGRSDLIREAGASYARIEEEEGIFLPVVEASVRYHKPAAYDELLDLETTADEPGRAQVTFRYSLSRKGDGELLATGRTRHAVLDRRKRPSRLPGWLRDLLEGG